MTSSFLGGRRLIPGHLLAGWRGLGYFWGVLLALLVISGGSLQWLGPSPMRPVPAPHGIEPAPLPKASVVQPHPTEHGVAETKAVPVGKPSSTPGRSTPGPIADPDPSLLELFGEPAHLRLPRIAADGRMPMNVYAAGFDPSNMRPKVGILVAGIGMSESDSLVAAKTLPGAISFAIAPYAGDITRLLSTIRITEHEYLLAIPMEPQGYPVNDPDDRYALMTSLAPAENLTRLQAILARQTGYVGVTDGLGQMQGERLAAMADQLDGVLEEVAHRGLLFLDARPGQQPLSHAWNRSADVVLDSGQFDAAVLDQRLDALTHLALDKGSAIGIVSVPRPLTLDRVAAWTNTLVSKGVALAPVSALVRPPAKQDFEK